MKKEVRRKPRKKLKNKKTRKPRKMVR